MAKVGFSLPAPPHHLHLQHLCEGTRHSAVHTTADSHPPKSGRPSTTTSNLRLSDVSGTGKSKSRTITLEVTCPQPLCRCAPEHPCARHATLGRLETTTGRFFPPPRASPPWWRPANPVGGPKSTAASPPHNWARNLLAISVALHWPTFVAGPPECSHCFCNSITIACNLCTSAPESATVVQLVAPAVWCTNLGIVSTCAGLPPHCELRPAALRRFLRSVALPVRCKRPSLGFGLRQALPVPLFRVRLKAARKHSTSTPLKSPKAVKVFCTLSGCAILVSGSILTGTLACSFARFRTAASSTFMAQSSAPSLPRDCAP